MALENAQGHQPHRLVHVAGWSQWELQGQASALAASASVSFGGRVPTQHCSTEQHRVLRLVQFFEGHTVVEPRGLGCYWTSPYRPIYQQGWEHSILFPTSGTPLCP